MDFFVVIIRPLHLKWGASNNELTFKLAGGENNMMAKCMNGIKKRAENYN
jgi:hypothetical protein